MPLESFGDSLKGNPGGRIRKFPGHVSGDLDEILRGSREDPESRRELGARRQKRTASGRPTRKSDRSPARESERCTADGDGHGGCNVTAAPRDSRGQLDLPRIGGHVALGVARSPPHAPARCPLVYRPPSTIAFAYAIGC